MNRLALGLAGLLVLTGCSRAQSLASEPATGLPKTAMLVLQSDPAQAIGIKNYLLFLVPVKSAARFNIVPGFADAKCVSFESVQFPGYYLRHQYCQLRLHSRDASDNWFISDATFVPKAHPSTPGGYMFRAFSPWWLWLSVTRDDALYVAPNPRYQDSVFLLKP